MGSLKGGTEGADIETPKLRLEKRSLEFKKKDKFVGSLVLNVVSVATEGIWSLILYAATIIILSIPRVTAVNFRADTIIVVVQRIGDCIYILY